MIPSKYNRVRFEFQDPEQPMFTLKHNQTDLVHQAVQSLKSLGQFEVVFLLDGIEVSRQSKNDILNYFKWKMVRDETTV